MLPGCYRWIDPSGVTGAASPPLVRTLWQRGRPSFWIGPLEDEVANRAVRVAFVAPSREAVRAFFDEAVAHGATVLHEPRVWPEYHATYYGGFVRDPDGNNVEAVCHEAW